MNFDEVDTRSTSEAGVELQLIDIRTGELSDAFITVRGVHSATVKKASHELLRKLAQRQRNKRGAAAVYDPLQQEEDELALLVAATVSWRNVRWGGEERPCTPENVKLFYQNFDAYRKQVDRFMGDDANFLPASATS